MSARIASPLAALGLVVALIGLAGLARTTPRAPEATVARSAPAPTGPIDVNVASAEALAALPRIGPTLAARIVEDREAHGPFRTIDELDRVPGLGPSTVRELRAHAIAVVSTE